jgi:hypothetical protein
MNKQVNIVELIHSSYSFALSKPVKSKSPAALHSTRSQAWVDSLAIQLKSFYDRDKNIRVFSKRDYSNRSDFGVNELLYDVVVCRVGTVESAKQKKTLYYIRDVIWQVESEFARDSRQTLIDFNKLVLGSAKNKLFIGPQVSDNLSFIDVLLPAANACQGEVFTTLIPHPDSWDEDDRHIDIWKVEDNKWMLLDVDV